MRLTELLARLEEDGILLLSDATLPSVVSLVAGERVRGSQGSWWSHPRGREIYALLERLTAHEDVLATKLVSRKVTFVHRRLWPALLAIARAREPWQMHGLSREARTLLARVDDAGELEARGPAVKELESRLLVHSQQVHTERGAHALVLTSWARWAKRRGPIGRQLPRPRAMRELEATLERVNELHGSNARLSFGAKRLRP